MLSVVYRATVYRTGVLVLHGGHNLPPMVEIGLTDLAKSGCAMSHLAHPGTTGLDLR